MKIPSELVVILLEQKIGNETLDLWDKNTQNDEFPTIDDVTEFLYKTAARLSRRNREQTSIAISKVKPAKSRKVEKRSGHVFLTAERKCIV